MDFLAHALLVENDLAVLAVVEAGGGVGDDLDEQRFHGGSFGKIGRGSEILALLQTQSQGFDKRVYNLRTLATLAVQILTRGGRG
ncbi:MAG: hypothetical protein E6J26_10180 [Chloroflexi bacterium]|nr:MAG: hypothetical protein E6J26_10180 [Chloroflexota bacterium]